MKVIENINRHLGNIFGWTSSRKFIVIESDDWGSIRMPSRNSFEKLVRHGLPVNKGDSNRFNQLDSLASPDDLDGLFGTLRKHKDHRGRNPVITAMSLVANPDFDRIRSSGFQEYILEPVTVTLERYGLKGSFDYWKQGTAEGLFLPQFHGREHLNVDVWMRALQSGDKFTRLAFEEGCWGFRNKDFTPINYQAAFDVDHPEDIEHHKEIIQSGLKMFEELHGFRATFFVPPNGPFNHNLSPVAGNAGIRFISTAKKHLDPFGNGLYKKSYHYLGQPIKGATLFLTRNASFEPSYKGIDWVGTCLKEIDAAFTWKKPAVISSHRVNYIGFHDERNRENGLAKLDELIEGILKKWPDAEFISSHELGEIIAKSKGYA